LLLSNFGGIKTINKLGDENFVRRTTHLGFSRVFISLSNEYLGKYLLLFVHEVASVNYALVHLVNATALYRLRIRIKSLIRFSSFLG